MKISKKLHSNAEEEYSLLVISGGSAFQVCVAPYPKNMCLELVSARISNLNGAAAQCVIWDQDLSGASTVTSVGSAGNGRAYFGVGAGLSGVAVTTAEFGAAGDGVNPKFYAGVVAQTSVPSMHIAFKFLIRRG